MFPLLISLTTSAAEDEEKLLEICHRYNNNEFGQISVQFTIYDQKNKHVQNEHLIYF